MKDDSRYIKANTDWLAACRYGLSVHWTAQTVSLQGPTLSFQKAVQAFDVKRFVNSVADTGADYLIFTSAHALQMLPAPNPVIDGILAGRTCKRDLIGEFAEELATRGIHLILYYNHSCNERTDPEWESAVGYHDPDKSRFADNICNIVRWMGNHYGERVKAWWFDSCYSVDPSGPSDTTSTDMTGFRFPWERLTKEAKAGFPSRLVSYNAGVLQTHLYTTHQDYWAGEMTDLDHPPVGRFTETGLQWHGWTCLDDRRWVQGIMKVPGLLYRDEQLTAFVKSCCLHQCPMTFNVSVFQDGTLGTPAVSQLQSLSRALK